MMKKRIVLFIAALVAVFTGCALFGCATKDGATHSVTFVLNYDGAPDGGVYQTQSVDDGATAEAPADPVRSDSYVFDGWCLDSLGATAVNVASIAINADTTFYARWKVASAPTPVDPNPPTPPAPTLDCITIVTPPTKLAYTVGETFDEAGLVVKATYDDNGSKTLSSAEYSLAGADTSTAGIKTVTITYGGKTAQFTITVTAPQVNSYAVTFAKNISGAPSGIPQAQTVTDGGRVSAPPVAPALDGYTFGGWYKEAACTNAWNFSADTVSSATTLYAKWTAIGYTVSYSLDGGDNAMANPATYSVTDGAVALAPATKAHYVFGGWYTAPDFAAGTDITAISAAMIPTSGTTIALYAKFTAEAYDIEYTLGGSASTFTVVWASGYNAPTSYAYGDAVTLPASDKLVITAHDGNTYNFVGWHVSGDDTAYVTAIGASDYGRKALVADITAAQTYTVTYHENYGSDLTHTQNVVENRKATAVAVSRAGYDLVAWKTSGGAAYDFNTPVTGNIDLYADWRIKSYTVTFKVGATTFDTQSVNHGETAKAPTTDPPAPQSGYEFDKWTLNSAAYSFATPVTGAVELVASFKPITYTITYSLNGGTNAVGNPATYTIADPDTTLADATAGTTGYYFVGWYSAGTGGDRVTAIDGDIISRASSAHVITLYARYSNVYTVTFDGNAASAAGVPAAVTPMYGETIAAPTSNPTLADHTFVGWYKDAAGSAAWSFATDRVNGNITLYAKWRANPDDGIYLFGTMTEWTVGDITAAANEVNPTQHYIEYTLTGVTLELDAEFILADYKKADGSITHIKAPAAFDVYATPSGAISFANSGDGNNNYKVTAYDDNLAGLTWRIVLGTNVYGNKFISVEAERVNELRDPSNNNNTITTTAEAADDVVYLMGNFNNGFKFSDAWSSGSTLIDVATIGNTYYFQGVYLKKNDALKVYDGGKWLGGSFASLGAQISLSGDNAPNICLDTIENGYYNLVFDKTAKKLTICESKTIEITVNKTVYAGDTLAKSDLTVTYGGDAVTAYTLDTSAAAVGDNTLTVVYSGCVYVHSYTANALAIASITVGGTLGKGTYSLGETFDPAGLTFTAVYNSGKTEQIAVADVAFASTAFGAGNSILVRSGSSVTIVASHAGKSVNISVTVDPFTVTFDSNGGSAVSSVTVTEWNAAVTSPSAPTKAHYSFGGWKLNGANYDFTAAVTGNITLVAAWTPDSHTVTLNLGGSPSTYIAMVSGGKTHVVAYGSTFTLPDSTRIEVQSADGVETLYTFLGWTLDLTDIAYITQITVESNITVYAHIAAVPTVEFTYVFKDGVTANRTENVQMGVLPPDVRPSRTGYSFGGWYEDDACVTTPYTRAEASTAKTLYAKWELDEYEIEYNMYGGTNAVGNPATYDVTMGSVTLADPAAAPVGKEFDYWSTALTGGDRVTQITLASFDDADTPLVLHAIYKNKTYSVTFDKGAADGVSGMPTTQTITHGGKVAEPTAYPARSGYEFVCWKKGSTEYDFDTAVTNDLVLTAAWRAKTYVDGIYVGDELKKAFKDNPAKPDEEFMAKYVVLAQNDRLTIRYNNAEIDVTLKTDYDWGMSRNITKPTGASYLLVGKTGTYCFYIEKSGYKVWITDEDDLVEPALQTGDGLYNGSALAAAFEIDDDRLNVVTAKDVVLGATANLTVTYAGQSISTVTIDEESTDGLVANGKISLSAGTYSFYYNYDKKVMLIERALVDPNPGLTYGSVDTANIGNDCWIVGKLGGVCRDFDWGKGYKLTWNNGQWEITIKLLVGDLIKFRRPFGDNENYGYAGITGLSGTNSSGSIVVDGNNLSVKKAGTYSFYVKAYNGDRAAHIVDNYIVYSA